MIYIESTQRNQSSTSSLTNLINHAVVTPETHAQDHDDYQERKLRRRASGSILGKLSKKASIPAKELLNIVKNTHKHSDHIAASIATGSAGTTTTDMATDAHAHVQNMILHDYHDREVAVMVSDLRGFTSTTRKYGIVHFASIIVRMRQLVYPIFDKYKAPQDQHRSGQLHHRVSRCRFRRRGCFGNATNFAQVQRFVVRRATTFQSTIERHRHRMWVGHFVGQGRKIARCARQ